MLCEGDVPKPVNTARHLVYPSPTSKVVAKQNELIHEKRSARVWHTASVQSKYVAVTGTAMVVGPDAQRGTS